MSKRFTKLTHANLHTPVGADLALVAFWWQSAGSKATHVMSTGGAVLPVLEPVEELDKRKAAWAAEGAPKKRARK